MQKRNSGLLKGLCVALPIVTLAAAHWFPWHRMMKRDLHPLEAYSIGTTAIVGTAGLAISLSDGDSDEHVTMLGIATVSAGGITIAAHLIDRLFKQDSKISNLEAQLSALKSNGKL